MPKLVCPNCKKELDKVVFVLEFDTSYDADEDAYLKAELERRIRKECPECRTVVEEEKSVLGAEFS